MARNKEKEVKSKIYIGSRTFDVVLYILMGLLSIVFIYPFLNVLAISFSGNSAIVTGQVTFFPRDFILDGYDQSRLPVPGSGGIAGCIYDSLKLLLGDLVRLIFPDASPLQ